MWKQGKECLYCGFDQQSFMKVWSGQFCASLKALPIQSQNQVLCPHNDYPQSKARINKVPFVYEGRKDDGRRNPFMTEYTGCVSCRAVEHQAVNQYSFQHINIKNNVWILSTSNELSQPTQPRIRFANRESFVRRTLPRDKYADVTKKTYDSMTHIPFKCRPNISAGMEMGTGSTESRRLESNLPLVFKWTTWRLCIKKRPKRIVRRWKENFISAVHNIQFILPRSRKSAETIWRGLVGVPDLITSWKFLAVKPAVFNNLIRRMEFHYPGLKELLTVGLDDVYRFGIWQTVKHCDGRWCRSLGGCGDILKEGCTPQLTSSQAHLCSQHRFPLSYLTTVSNRLSEQTKLWLLSPSSHHVVHCSHQKNSEQRSFRLCSPPSAGEKIKLHCVSREENENVSTAGEIHFDCALQQRGMLMLYGICQRQPNLSDKWR